MAEINVQIPKKAFNTAYLPLLNNDNRYLVLYGGAGSGKSYFIAERYIVKLMRSDMCNILVVRAVGNTNRDSTFALFKQVISKWGLNNLFKVNESDLRIVCSNGNSVIFKGLDDTEKLKSITFPKGELTDVWIEEASETLEKDFNQLDIRLRGKGTKKQIVISFNPIDIKHWLKKRFFDRKDSNITISHTTYKDNRFLDDDYISLLESYKKTDPYYYDVYCLGQWGVLGSTIFDKNKIQERIRQITDPIKKGSFLFNTKYNEEKNQVLILNDTIKWQEDKDGAIWIYKEPVKGKPYVQSGDTSGDGSDYFANHIIDNTTGEQVAILHQEYDEDIYAEQTYCLGIYYNKALTGIETNYSTYPVKRLSQLHYPKQYVRERPDTYTGNLVDAFGWVTSSKTRPTLIAEAVLMVREHIELINDRKTLEEMLTFARNEKGKPEAVNGAHDDLVISYGIVLSIRSQQSYLAEKPKKPKGHYTKEMLADWQKGNKDERKVMETMWGSPY